MKQFEAAAADVLAELKLSDKNPLLWNCLGTFCNRFGRYYQAVEAYDKAISLDAAWKTPRSNRERSIENHAGILSGEILAPVDDLKAPAAMAPKRATGKDFWLKVGREEELTMTAEGREGDKIVRTTVRMKTIRVDCPRHRRAPLACHIPLQKAGDFKCDN